MCDFNHLSSEEKLRYHQILIECAESLGGINFFLQLLEAVRASKSHPLIASNHSFSTANTTVKWDKIIFKDKLTLLFNERKQESARGNLLPPKDAKNYKNVLNMIRTLAPIKFDVKPNYRKDGKGFTMKPFDRIDDETTKLNPVFDAIFFCSIDTVKKVLTYKGKGE